MAMGYRALKWDPFDTADLEMDKAQRRATIAIVEAVRAASAPHRADARRPRPPQRPHRHRHVPRARALTISTWIEEPTPPESIDALAEVRATPARSPIAAGERWYEPGRVAGGRSTKKAVDILQPDVSPCRRPSARPSASPTWRTPASSRSPRTTRSAR